MMVEKEITEKKLETITEKEVADMFVDDDLLSINFNNLHVADVDKYLANSYTKLNQRWRTKFYKQHNLRVNKINSIIKFSDAELKPGIVTNMLKLHLLILSDLYDILEIINCDETPLISNQPPTHCVNHRGQRTVVKFEHNPRQRVTLIPSVTPTGDDVTPMVVCATSSLRVASSVQEHTFIGNQLKGKTEHKSYYFQFIDKMALSKAALPERAPVVDFFGHLRTIIKMHNRDPDSEVDMGDVRDCDDLKLPDSEPNPLQQSTDTNANSPLSPYIDSEGCDIDSDSDVDEPEDFLIENLFADDDDGEIKTGPVNQYINFDDDNNSLEDFILQLKVYVNEQKKKKTTKTSVTLLIWSLLVRKLRLKRANLMRV